MSIPEKGCIKCRHFSREINEEPCKSCIDADGFSKWEPDEQGQEEKSINEEMTLELKMETEL